MGFASNKVGSSRNEGRDVADMIAELTPNAQPLLIEVRRLRFYSEETGFFVLDGIPAGPMPPLPAELADYAANLKRGIPVKGESMMFATGGDPSGNTIACHGRWTVDPTHGLQFQTTYLIDVLPSNPEGLFKYLSAGRLRGIGPATARLIVDRWGMDALRMLDEDPVALAEVSGINRDKAIAIGERWKERRANFEIVAFFGQYGIGENMTMRIADAMGRDGLIARVRNNPYLMTEVDGVGFKTADQMALSLGFSLDSKLRIEAALDHVLRERIQQGGNTAIPLEEWKSLSAQYLNYPVSEIEPHCNTLIRSTRVALRVLDAPLSPGSAPLPVHCVSPAPTATTEITIAEQMRRLQQQVKPRSLTDQARLLQGLEDPVSNLDPSQKAAAWTLLNSPISIMTGGPGTGKTTTLRTVVRLLESVGANVVLAAPTGRASKRMEEAIGSPAMTMHRRLGFLPGNGFKKNEGDPMVGDAFVLDESSMVDSSMCCAWLRAIPSGSRVIFVGDADQLPSVGPGDVLRNLIDSGRVPVARLAKVHRQAEGSGIAQAAQQVLSGRAPVGTDFAGDDFAFVRADDNMAILAQIETLVRDSLSKGFKHQDIQILCPQKPGDVGTDSLNHRLRWLLNPQNPNQDDPDLLASKRGWCLGERLMQTKNNYDLGVFNGDMGTVVDILDDGGVKLEMEDGTPVEFKAAATKDLVLGYAITVHKSQGGERPVVIMPVSPSHTYTLNRNLIYTGITRGKQRVRLVGSPRTAVVAAEKKDQTRRLTGLNHEIEGAYARNEPVPPARGQRARPPTP